MKRHLNSQGASSALEISSAPKKKGSLWKEIKQDRQLYLMILFPLIYIIVFKYYPMFGAQIAFRDYLPVNGIWGSKWVGLNNFARFFSNPNCWKIIRNTVAISTYTLVFSIPFPIILAILLDYTKSRAFRKTVQTVVFAPHFLSIVLIVGIMNLILDNRTGVINNIIELLIGHKINFLGTAKFFRSLHVWSGIWQQTGWNSVLYIAALAGVDPQIHEAAIIDGASKFRRVWHIDLTSILPTIVIMTIMNLGTIFTVGFDKSYLMQNSLNLEYSEVLSTYEYKMGTGGLLPSYSYASAVGLLTSVVNFTLIVLSNKIANKLSGSGLW